MNTTDKISKIIEASIEESKKNKTFPNFDSKKITVEKPKNKSFGNWSTNIALTLSKELKKKPLEIAEIIKSNIRNSSIIETVEIIPPGFINFRLSNSFRSDLIDQILSEKENYGSNKTGANKKVQLEFVSVNPTGPVHVGHARGAIVGSCLAKLLSYSGYDVHKEYYVNDAGNQIDLYVSSVKSKIYENFNQSFPFPKDGYKGKNIEIIGEKVIKKLQITESNLTKIDDKEIKDAAINLTLNVIKKDLIDLGIEYDNWFYESSLFTNKTIQNIEKILDDKNLLYKQDGAKWFKSSNFYTDDDVVINRSDDDGHTYFFSDMAYHYDKFIIRNFETVINIFGADHHSHVNRLKSAISSFEIDVDKLRILLTQIVHFKNEEKVQKFSKRSGNIYTVRDLISIVGKDVCRFNFLNRSLDSQQEFDLELATKESSENPVYYVQYAYARISSIIDSFDEKTDDVNLSILENDFEKNLIDTLDFFPEVILESTLKLQTHNITQYAIELAKDFQIFYENCRVISENKELTQARIKLVLACRIVLKNTLDIMGVNAPERM